MWGEGKGEGPLLLSPALPVRPECAAQRRVSRECTVFPLDISGQVAVPDATALRAPALIAHFERALVRERASSVSTAGNRLTFRVGMFRFVSNMNILAFIGSGEIEIQPGSPATVSFRFSCLRSLLAMTAIASGLALHLASGPISPAIRFWIPVGMWLWLFGANYLIASSQLRQFVRNVVAESSSSP